MSSLLKSPLPRLFQPGVQLALGQALSIAGPQHHYLTRVLRLTTGDRLLILDGGGGVAEACITAISSSQLTAEPQRIEAAARAGALPDLWLLFGMLKGERHDLVIQKATELGAAAIVSIACQRSIPTLHGERADKRQARWLRVAEAAAQQCRRLAVPRISPPLSLPAALAEYRAGTRLLLSEGVAPPLRTLLPGWPESPSVASVQTQNELGPSGVSTECGPAPRTVALLIGPEGGLTDDEVGLASGEGYQPCSLGPHILRAETAAIAALAATTALLMQ
jgi:16S rRNA (uracil1498-N3)-methyltransferase